MEHNPPKSGKQRKRFKNIRELIFILSGIGLGALGLNGFLLPNRFIDGGATGLALLFAETTTVDLSYAVIIANVPFVVLGYFQMSNRFIIKSALAIVALSLLLLAPFPVVTTDPVLSAVFGGFFLGAGIGMSVRGGCVIDGTEILALYLTRRFNVSIGDVTIIVNALIFALAALLLGIETALYSMLCYFFAAKTMDFVLQGIEEYLGITIMSERNDVIKQRIVDEMGTGVTILSSEGGFGNKGKSPQKKGVLYAVITRLEYSKIQKIVEDCDPTAFFVIQGVKDVRGGMLRKRVLPS